MRHTARRLARASLLCTLSLGLLAACGSDNGSAGAPTSSSSSSSSSSGSSSSSSSGSSSGSTPPVTVTMSGTPQIKGLVVRSGGAVVNPNGSGGYTVPAGSLITFYAGSVELTTVSAKAQMNLFDLVANRSCQSGPELARTASLLYALSTSQDDSVIVLPAAAANAASVQLSSLSESDLLSLENTLAGRSVPLNAALLKLNAQIDQETWTASSNRSVFDSDVPTLETYLGGVVAALPDLSALNAITDQNVALIPAQFRTEGIAYTGSGVVFSWRYGLQRTDMNYSILATKPMDVPADILAQQEQLSQYDPSQRFTPGASHIGDIDAANGKLYASIEDENLYNLPYIALFDPQTLAYTGEKHLLPQNLLTEGVPWIAVDAKRGQFYTAEWENTKVLDVFDLNTFELIRTVPLQSVTPALTRIQGAKIYNGMLYASADTSDTADPVLGTKRKRVYRIDPVSGNVTEALHYDVVNHTEAEGIAFYDTADGPMHVEAVSPYVSAFSNLYGFNGDDMSTEVALLHYQLTRPSLRQSMCTAQ